MDTNVESFDVPKKLSPFEVASNINEKGEYLALEQSGYDPFLINRIFSNTKDSVFFANEMNCAWALDKEMQYAFYYHGLTKKKRFGKWHKNQDDKEQLEIIQQFLGYSRNKAKSVHSMLLPHLDLIRAELEQGGRRR